MRSLKGDEANKPVDLPKRKPSIAGGGEWGHVEVDNNVRELSLSVLYSFVKFTFVATAVEELR